MTSCLHIMSVRIYRHEIDVQSNSTGGNTEGGAEPAVYDCLVCLGISNDGSGDFNGLQLQQMFHLDLISLRNTNRKSYLAS